MAATAARTAAHEPAVGPLAMVPVRVADVVVRLFRPTTLEHVVDVDALLRDEAAPEPPYWMHLWPGSVALARRVAGDARVGPGLRALELGCGLGLPALVAARRGARVVASDRLHAPLALLGTSTRANGLSLARLQMDWAAPALGERVDLCLGADIAYDCAAEPALVAALAALVRADGQAWLADSVNTARTTLVDHLRQVGFEVRVECVQEEDEHRPVWVRIIEARRR